MSSNLSRSIGVPVTGAVLAFAGSKLLYGQGLILNTPYGQVDLALAMGLAAAVGLGVSEFTHDYIFKTIHVSEKLANPATIGVNTAINFGAQLGLLSLMNEGALAEVDKAKLLAESVGVVIGADYLYSNFIGPMWGDVSHTTYSN
jgi:hypothetical protein